MKEPAVGDTVDRRFLLKREIARGGMGAVFEAEQCITGRLVAVKMVHPHVARLREAQERLLREARAITAARHPGIVELLDAGLCSSFGPYMVMEMLQGRTLEGIIAARRTLPIDQVAHLGRQMCEALAFVHARGIVHRDLKPSNVYITREPSGDERVKLFDFGIASLADATLSRRRTGKSELLGTPEYMSPEQLFGELPADDRSDVYAVGVTLFECLAGKVPYGGTYAQVLMAISKTREPPSVREARPEVPEALDRVLVRALQRDRGVRYPSAAELGCELVAATGLESGWTTLLGPRPTESGWPGEPEADEHDPSRDTAPIPLVRRRYQRVPYATAVTVRHDGGPPSFGHSEDISEGGMLMTVDGRLQKGLEVTVSFALPLSSERVRVRAVVRWAHGQTGRRSAVGVEFLDLAPEVRRVIAAFVGSANSEPARATPTTRGA